MGTSTTVDSGWSPAADSQRPQLRQQRLESDGYPHPSIVKLVQVYSDDGPSDVADGTYQAEPSPRMDEEGEGPQLQRLNASLDNDDNGNFSPITYSGRILF